MRVRNTCELSLRRQLRTKCVKTWLFVLYFLPGGRWWCLRRRYGAFASLGTCILFIVFACLWRIVQPRHSREDLATAVEFHSGAVRLDTGRVELPRSTQSATAALCRRGRCCEQGRSTCFAACAASSSPCRKSDHRVRTGHTEIGSAMEEGIALQCFPYFSSCYAPARRTRI